MNNALKFISFLESLENDLNKPLITTIKSGFLTCFEANTSIHLKHGSEPDSKFIKTQLKTGTEVEKEEHTEDESVAKQIAKAHLSEFPTYYTHLKKMEDKAKKDLTHN